VIQGTELISVDALYALERALLQYPGIQFVGIADQGMLATEDEEGDEEITLDLYPRNMYAMLFTGPQGMILILPFSALLTDAIDYMGEIMVSNVIMNMEESYRRHINGR
jgi:hypothetical protein